MSNAPSANDQSAELLFNAIFEGNFDLVSNLLKQSPSLINAEDAYHGHRPLHHAMYWSQPSIAELLLQRGADVNARARIGRTPLHIAPVHQDARVLQILLSNGANPNQTDDWGRLPLHYANSKRAVELLLAAGATFPTPDSDPSKFQYALRRGSVDLMKLLISQGFDINKKDNGGATPLSIAAGSNNLPVVDLLLELGADPNPVDQHDLTPMYWAVWGGKNEVLLSLMRHGGKMSGRSDIAPVHVAASFGQPSTTALLLSLGADVNMVDKDGATPLHRAASHTDGCEDERQKATAELLLHRGAAINAEDRNNCTPLHNALLASSRVMAQTLLSHGAAIDPFAAAALARLDLLSPILDASPDLLSKTGPADLPLMHWAVLANEIAPLELLLQHGANIDTPDADNLSPLQTAIEQNKPEAAAYLIRQGANANHAGNDQLSPLHLAAAYAQAGIARELLQRGADVDASDSDGKTALHFSADSRNPELVLVLLQAGAHVNAMTKSGKTPLDYALAEQDEAISAMLRSHNAQPGSTFH